MRKKFRQKYRLFIQNTCLYRISTFYEKRIDTAEGWESIGFRKLSRSWALDIAGILHLPLKNKITTSILVQKPHKQMQFFHKKLFWYKLDALKVYLSH